MESNTQPQLAVLIDADNANAKRIDGLLAEVAKYGRATTKRAYGDWTNTHLGSWKQTLARHAIQPMQQFSNTRGKNSTDSALIIDAMDLLYTERFDGFCIVSSDSDFTRLASRIREAGLTVYGFGERKTPQPFVRACDRFIYVEVLREGEADEESVADAAARNSNDRNRSPQNGRKPQPAPAAAASNAPAARPAPAPAAKPADNSSTADERPAAATRGAPLDDPALLNPLRAAVADACDDDGWAGLGAVGSLIGKRMPEFDPRNWGRKKLSDLFAAIAIFEIDERGEPGRSRALFVREKRDRDGGESSPQTAAPMTSATVDVAAAGDAAAAPAVAPAPPTAPKHEARPPQHQPRPAQAPKPPQQGPRPPRPVSAGLPSEPSDEELKALADVGWAPRRDDRRPTWAVTPVPIVPSAAAPVAAPSPVAEAVQPVTIPVVAAEAPAPEPAVEAVAAPAAIEAKPAARKAAVKKAAASKSAAPKPATKAKAAPAPNAEIAPESAAAKPRGRKPAAAKDKAG